MRQLIFVSVFMALLLVLGGCATSSPDVVQRGDAQRMSRVEEGVLLSLRPVVIDGSQSGAGALVGGVTGAVAGASLSGMPREARVLGLLAGVAGAVAGNAIERSATREDAFEMLIQLRGGERRAVVQAKGSEALYPGDAVILITTGGKVRVTRAPR